MSIMPSVESNAVAAQQAASNAAANPNKMPESSSQGASWWVADEKGEWKPTTVSTAASLFLEMLS